MGSLVKTLWPEVGAFLFLIVVTSSNTCSLQKAARHAVKCNGNRLAAKNQILHQLLRACCWAVCICVVKRPIWLAFAGIRVRSSLCLRFANTGKVAASGANVYRKCVFVQIVLASADFIQVTCMLSVCA